MAERQKTLLMVRISEENIGTEAEGTVGHNAESILGVQKWAVGREATVKKNTLKGQEWVLTRETTVTTCMSNLDFQTIF